MTDETTPPDEEDADPHGLAKTVRIIRDIGKRTGGLYGWTNPPAFAKFSEALDDKHKAILEAATLPADSAPYLKRLEREARLNEATFRTADSVEALIEIQTAAANDARQSNRSMVRLTIIIAALTVAIAAMTLINLTHPPANTEAAPTTAPALAFQGRYVMPRRPPQHPALHARLVAWRSPCFTASRELTVK